MYRLHKKLRLGPDTFFMAVYALDRFLHSVQAQLKYLQCVVVSCLFLAAKICEEEEVSRSRLLRACIVFKRETNPVQGLRW